MIKASYVGSLQSDLTLDKVLHFRISSNRERKKERKKERKIEQCKNEKGSEMDR